MYAKFPKEIMAELLLYLADREPFDSLKELGSISPKHFRQALAQLAQELKEQAHSSGEAQETVDLSQSLKKPHQELLQQLQPEERERLLKGFLN